MMNSRVLNTKSFNLKKWIMAKINDGTNSERYYWKFLYSTLFLTVSNCIQLWLTVLYRSLYFQILGWFLANCTVRYCTVTVLCVTLVATAVLCSSINSSNLLKINEMNWIYIVLIQRNINFDQHTSPTLQLYHFFLSFLSIIKKSVSKITPGGPTVLYLLFFYFFKWFRLENSFFTSLRTDYIFSLFSSHVCLPFRRESDIY